MNFLKFEQIQIPGVNNIIQLYFQGDTAYILTSKYEKDGEVFFEVTIECDLDLQIKKVISQDKNTVFIDEYLQFYTEDLKTYVFNRKTNETKELGNTIFGSILYHDGYYIVDNSLYYDDTPRIILMNRDGNIIAEKDLRGSEASFHYPTIFTGDRLYVSRGDSKFGYFPIENEQIKDYVELVKMK